MLTYPTLENLHALRLTGMASALEEQLQMPEVNTLSFEERLGLMLEREATEREDRRLRRRLKQAKLRQEASMEDIDYRSGRGLKKPLMLQRASCAWVKRHYNALITGPTGVGKSYIACALAHKACLEGHTALYRRLPRLLEELTLAHGDGRYLKMMKKLTKVDVLVQDDWGLAQLSAAQQRDPLDLLDDRHDRKSTVVTSQLPTKHWHEMMADPTLADALLDRLIHNAYHLQLKGESTRKHLSDVPQAVHSSDQPDQHSSALQRWTPCLGIGGRDQWNTQAD